MIEKISESEYIVTGNHIADRKFIISKPASNYRVEMFTKRKHKGEQKHIDYFGRILSEKGNLRYFKTMDEAISFIYRQDFNN